jgi:F0F1-type ATP synthase epsilon subunit
VIELTFIKPTSQRIVMVQWLRAETPTGNLIIKTGHAPLITLLSPFKAIEFGLEDGSIEHYPLPGGILEIQRTKAIVIIDE